MKNSKKNQNLSIVTLFMLLIFTAVSPLIIPYALWGKHQNGYTVYYDPSGTRVIDPNSIHPREIVDENHDCTPDYTQTGKPAGKFTCISRNSPTAEDYKIWAEAMK